MKITIEQAELEQAVRDYVLKNGIRREVKAIEFTASRGDAGTVTTVELGKDLPADTPTVASEAVVEIAPEPAPEVVPKASEPAVVTETKKPEPVKAESPVEKDDQEVPKRLFGSGA